jgi:hypothetical protein
MVNICMSLEYKPKISDSQTPSIATPDVWSNGSSDSSFQSIGHETPEDYGSNSTFQSRASAPIGQPARLLAPKEGPPLAWNPGHAQRSIAVSTAGATVPGPGWNPRSNPSGESENGILPYNWDGFDGVDPKVDLEVENRTDSIFDPIDIDIAWQQTQQSAYHSELPFRSLQPQEEEFSIYSLDQQSPNSCFDFSYAIDFPYSQDITWENIYTLRGLNTEPLFTAGPQTQP